MRDHLTDGQLDAMQASADQATPGPWEIIGGYQYVTGVDVVIGAIDEGCIRLRDAEFIAHARTDVPALIAEVRRLREQRREALAVANADAAQWEQENHTPTVWAGEIRDALEADDE